MMFNVYDDDDEQENNDDFEELGTFDDMTISPSASFEQVPKPQPLARWQELCDSLHEYVLQENLYLKCTRHESECQQILFADFIKYMYKYRVLDNDPNFAATHIAHVIIYVRRAHAFRRSELSKSVCCDICSGKSITLFYMIVACFIIADKTINDTPYGNDSYAKLARVPLEAVTAAEFYTMHLLDWNAAVSEDEVAQLVRL